MESNQTQRIPVLKWRNLIIGLAIIIIVVVGIPLANRYWPTNSSPNNQLSPQEQFLVGTWIPHAVGYLNFPLEQGVPTHMASESLQRIWEHTQQMHFTFDGTRRADGQMTSSNYCFLGNRHGNLRARWTGTPNSWSYIFYYIQFITYMPNDGINFDDQNDVVSVMGHGFHDDNRQDFIRFVMGLNSQGRAVFYTFVRK